MTYKIISLAEKLVAEHGTRDPIELCCILGISTVYADLPFSVHGFYMEQDGRQAVVVSSNLLSPHDRYCAAHELGHALLHREINSVFITQHTCLSVGRYEREADLFAAALLIDGESLTEGTSIEDICRQTALPESAVMQYINSFCKI